MQNLHSLSLTLSENSIEDNDFSFVGEQLAKLQKLSSLTLDFTYSLKSYFIYNNNLILGYFFLFFYSNNKAVTIHGIAQIYAYISSLSILMAVSIK